MEQTHQNNEAGAQVTPYALMEIVTKGGAMMDVELETAEEVTKVEDMILNAIQGNSANEFVKLLKKGDAENPEQHTLVSFDKDIFAYRLYIL